MVLMALPPADHLLLIERDRGQFVPSRRRRHDGQRRLLKIPAEPSPELRIPNAAAQTRVVSLAGIRLGCWESARAFKGIICDDISEFESYMPSQPVRSPPPPMPRPLKTARHRGILQTSLSLRVRKVAADAPFQRIVSEAYFWRLVVEGWRTHPSASGAPFLPRCQLIDDCDLARTSL